MADDTLDTHARRAPKSALRQTLETLAIALPLALFVRATVAEARYIPSESMLPTLEVNDRLIVEKVSYHLHRPRRGDIVVFDPPPRAHEAGNVLIKRVIGLPGEHLAIEGGRVLVDGRALTEPYTLEAPAYPPPDWASLGMPGGVVPEGRVFVMGDNRNNSLDSHVWGALPVSDIIGHAAFRYWPVARFGSF